MKNVFLMIVAALMMGVVYAGDMYEVPVRQAYSTPAKVTTTKIIVQNHPRYILPPPAGYVPPYAVYPRPIYVAPRPVHCHHHCPAPRRVHHHHRH